ncbi:complement factor D-like [Carassius auratus]|uniref:Complement factor D-like n=1 Tax=Carassius auratus TaxID=7957 RepID=A0A6P6M711_CARAU|nr:complement factor D-like [Carassius auratus]
MMTIISLLLLASLLSHLNFTVGIVNGWEAKPHSRPYMVSIQSNGIHVCGGSLISDQWVLTAAHCWNRNENLTVVVGAHDLRESKNSDHIGVKSYIQHPSYSGFYISNNIMLLKLQEKVNINNNYVKSISLPKNGEDVKTNTFCSVAGWGQLEIEGPKSDRLMEANVCIMNESECHKRWGNLFLETQMMCAHGHGGSCRYDSGGPLVCGDTAIGVTAFGDSSLCNSPKKPNVYIKISEYIPWINIKIR